MGCQGLLHPVGDRKAGGWAKETARGCFLGFACPQIRHTSADPNTSNGSSPSEGAIQIQKRPWEKPEVERGRRSRGEQEGLQLGLAPPPAGREVACFSISTRGGPLPPVSLETASLSKRSCQTEAFPVPRASPPLISHIAPHFGWPYQDQETLTSPGIQPLRAGGRVTAYSHPPKAWWERC